jgi:hypothetical protein
MELLLALLMAFQEEKVDNPEYRRWACCAVGSWVTTKMEMTLNGVHSESEVTKTLMEVGKDSLIIEETHNISTGGTLILGEPSKTKILARISISAAPEKVNREGSEGIELDGKKIICRWEQRGSEPYSRIWLSNEIPGGIAKSVLTEKGVPTISQVVIKWERKK